MVVPRAADVGAARCLREHRHHLSGVAGDDAALVEAGHEIIGVPMYRFSPTRRVACEVVDAGGDRIDVPGLDADADIEAVEVAIDAGVAGVEHRDAGEQRLEIDHPERLIHARQQQSSVLRQLREHLRMRAGAAESDAVAAAGRPHQLLDLAIDFGAAPAEHVERRVRVLACGDAERRDEPVEALLAIDVEVEDRHEARRGR